MHSKHSRDNLTWRSISGSGYLMLNQKSKVQCDIQLFQLLNGRLLAQAYIEETPRNLSRAQNIICKFTGSTDDGRRLTVTNIDVSKLILHHRNDGLTLEGFVCYPECIEVINPGNATVVVQEAICELSNFHLYGHLGSVAGEVEKAQIQLDRLHDYECTTHLMQSLKISGVLGELRISLPQKKSEEWIDELVTDLCDLLSIAQRTWVRPVSMHWIDKDEHAVKSRYLETPFPHSKATYPLIPIGSLSSFIQSSFGSYKSQYEKWRLGQAQEHYLQALSSNTAWPQSIGFYTALETIKAAFFGQDGMSGKEYYAPEGKGFIDKVITFLEENFEVFKSLNDGEKRSLRGRIGNLNQRAYKWQLITLFEKLDIDVGDEELRALMHLRNQLIHRGYPDYETQGWESPSEAFRLASKCGSVVERLILAILGYEGESKLYDTTFQSSRER